VENWGSEWWRRTETSDCECRIGQLPDKLTCITKRDMKSWLRVYKPIRCSSSTLLCVHPHRRWSSWRSYTASCFHASCTVRDQSSCRQWRDDAPPPWWQRRRSSSSCYSSSPQYSQQALSRFTKCRRPPAPWRRTRGGLCEVIKAQAAPLLVVNGDLPQPTPAAAAPPIQRGRAAGTVLCLIYSKVKN
jgi:hypothetical protein